jgi:hypothetical protein
MTVTESHTEPVTYGSDRLAQLIATIGEGALERERSGERPFAAIDLVRRAGLGALRIPREDGGGGASLCELFGVVIALATADVNVAHILRGHFAHVEERLRLDADQRQRVTDLALSGAIVGNASTEIGSTTVGEFTWQTRLTCDGDGFRLNGTKYFTTGTLYADYAEVLASDPHGATVIALVPTDRTGVTVHDDWDGMGQRATGTGTAIFENVAVAPEETLPFAPPDAGSEPPPLYLSEPSSSCTSPRWRSECCTRCAWTPSPTCISGHAASRGHRRCQLPTIRCCSGRSARSPAPRSRPRRPCWQRPTRSRSLSTRRCRALIRT